MINEEKIKRAKELRQQGKTIKECQQILKAEFGKELSLKIYKNFELPSNNSTPIKRASPKRQRVESIRRTTTTLLGTMDIADRMVLELKMLFRRPRMFISYEIDPEYDPNISDKPNLLFYLNQSQTPPTEGNKLRIRDLIKKIGNDMGKKCAFEF